MNPPETETPVQTPPGLEWRALVLVLFMALLAGGSVLYLLYARGFFEPTQKLVLLADDSEGITVGMDVTFSGFPIGRVSRIELGADGNVHIRVEVPRKDARWLRTSSVFTVERGMVGGTRLRAFTGLMDDPPLPDGAERRVLRGDALAELPTLITAVKDLLANLQAMTAADAALNASLANVQAVTERLRGPRGALGAVFGNDADARKVLLLLDRTNTLLARLDGLTSRADSQVFGAQGLVPEARATAAQLNGLLGEARASLQRVDALLVDAQAIAGQTRVATQDLGALRAEVEASLRKVDHLVNEVNRKWPFARDPEIRLP
jgi:phospholipid/cholesterol/gamma-HCH transport system substrate-binding protein